MNINEKRLFLKQFVKSDQSINELIEYTQNKFIPKKHKSNSCNIEFVKTWKKYHKESEEIGSFNTLKKYIVQLQFPLKEGISKTKNYKNTTLRGKQKIGEEHLILNQPQHIVLDFYENEMTGKIPVIVIPDSNDFNTIICALSNKNEPKELPNSMGAMFIKGINNWDRINNLKTDWLKSNPFGNWSETFKNEILPKPHLFKDNLIILSTKDYSGVKNSEVGLSEKEWKTSSLLLRREHECTHLFTLQYYGFMANNIHDEIVADYAGIIKVLDCFNKDWFLHFMGLKNFPNYREGGRLQNYKAPIKISPEAFNGLRFK